MWDWSIFEGMPTFLGCRCKYSAALPRACSDFVCNTQVQRDTGLWYSAEYSTFSITDEADNYTLSVAGYSGDAGDAMRGNTAGRYNSNGKKFTTNDRDNDNAGHNCAVQHDGGWWYDFCSRSRLNRNALTYWTTNSGSTDVQASRMLVRIK